MASEYADKTHAYVITAARHTLRYTTTLRRRRRHAHDTTFRHGRRTAKKRRHAGSVNTAKTGGDSSMRRHNQKGYH